MSEQNRSVLELALAQAGTVDGPVFTKEDGSVGVRFDCIEVEQPGDGPGLRMHLSYKGQRLATQVCADFKPCDIWTLRGLRGEIEVRQ